MRSEPRHPKMRIEKRRIIEESLNRYRFDPGYQSLMDYFLEVAEEDGLEAVSDLIDQMRIVDETRRLRERKADDVG